MLHRVGLAALVASASATPLGCARRITFDFSEANNPAVGFDWQDATGQNYSPGPCPCESVTGGCTGANRVSTCPGNGVPYGTINSDPPPNAAFPNGRVRYKSVGYDGDNNGRSVDMLVTSIPTAQKHAYSTSGPIQMAMEYNSVISPYTDNWPASQAILTKEGYACLGFGLRPSTCASGAEVLADTALCADGSPITARAAEFKFEFVFSDTQQVVSPPFDGAWIYFWDVDGDSVNNGLNAAVPAVPVMEAVHEYNSVWDAITVDYTGARVLTGTFGSSNKLWVGGKDAFNVPTLFNVNPTTIPVPTVSAEALGVFQTGAMTSFNIMIGGRSAVGKLYVAGRDPSTTPPGALRPQNDRGYCFNMLQPEPICGCSDPCPAACLSPSCPTTGACTTAGPGGTNICGQTSGACETAGCPTTGACTTAGPGGTNICGQTSGACETAGCPSTGDCATAGPGGTSLCGQTSGACERSTGHCPTTGDCATAGPGGTSLCGQTSGACELSVGHCPTTGWCATAGPNGTNICGLGSQSGACATAGPGGSNICCTPKNVCCAPKDVCCKTNPNICCKQPNICCQASAPSWCARNPSCPCPAVCKNPTCASSGACTTAGPGGTNICGQTSGACETAGPGGSNICCLAGPECGMHPQCPTTDCPAECDPSSPNWAYLAYCKMNPKCQCPAACKADCATTGTGQCLPASVCSAYAACPAAVSRTCPPPPMPLPPPFPPPFPPLPCLGWCTENTCGKDECKGCSVCDTVSAGNYCASWCNAYTCASEHELCQGCSICNRRASSSCYSWCSAYTCFGSCTSCSVCGQVSSGSYCASWCNAYTCGGLFTGLCGGCSECAEVSSNTYCASWCNSYTCGGVFSGLCGGCSACA